MMTERLKATVSSFGLRPTLYVFTSPNEASQVYVRNKIKKGEEIGVKVVAHPVSTLTDVLDVLDDVPYPFIIQEPSALPKEDVDYILNQYSYKDMDGFSSNNLGKLFKGLDCIKPCTPNGIMELLKFYNIPVYGHNVIIIGRSNIVGKPLCSMMEQAGATVTLCHSKTPYEELIQHCSYADIVVSAVGKIDILNGVASRSWQTLVDVGINKNQDGKICGDFGRGTIETCGAYTPVPGGVGPMTVIMLMKNVVDYWQRCLDF